jgi:hypothetical protein
LFVSITDTKIGMATDIKVIFPATPQHNAARMHNCKKCLNRLLPKIFITNFIEHKVIIFTFAPQNRFVCNKLKKL